MCKEPGLSPGRKTGMAAVGRWLESDKQRAVVGREPAVGGRGKLPGQLGRTGSEGKLGELRPRSVTEYSVNPPET